MYGTASATQPSGGRASSVRQVSQWQDKSFFYDVFVFVCVAQQRNVKEVVEDLRKENAMNLKVLLPITLFVVHVFPWYRQAFACAKD
jgi:hypothetical protein